MGIGNVAIGGKAHEKEGGFAVLLDLIRLTITISYAGTTGSGKESRKTIFWPVVYGNGDEVNSKWKGWPIGHNQAMIQITTVYSQVYDKDSFRRRWFFLWRTVQIIGYSESEHATEEKVY